MLANFIGDGSIKNKIMTNITLKKSIFLNGEFYARDRNAIQKILCKTYLHYDSPLDMPGDKVRGIMAFKCGSFGGAGFDSWEKMLKYADIVVASVEDFIKYINENIDHDEN